MGGSSINGIISESYQGEMLYLVGSEEGLPHSESATKERKGLAYEKGMHRCLNKERAALVIKIPRIPFFPYGPPNNSWNNFPSTLVCAATALHIPTF
ncbi:hypothetical protein H5410_050121 [Solanum commersonii]|uniref:Uncharacterized protein n=1 Tax=Solanum commersonii TaxID=4109 RepID=A0A9J5WX22_SOLCO|nr:hypothetical protein H5410_050121 [Solanum commersonii]